MTIVDESPQERDGPDGPLWRWQVDEAGRSFDIDVIATGTAAASDPDQLPSQVGEAVRSHGRSAVESCLAGGRLPEAIYVDTGDIAAVGRDSITEAVPGEAVFVVDPHDTRWWTKAVVVRHGEQAEALVVDDPQVEAGPHGPGRRGRDIAVVRRLSDGEQIRVAYGDVRRRWSVL